MKFSICNETFRHHDFEGSCAEARRHGYTGIEIAPFTLGSISSISEKRSITLGNLIRAYDLELVGLHWLLAKTEGYHLTHPDPETQKRTFDYTRRLTDICHDMGGKIMVWGSPLQRSLELGWNRSEAEKRVVHFFQQLSPHLAAAGVTVAFEFLGPKETNFINTAEETIQLLKQINSPHVRLNLDVKAMASDRKSIPQVIRESMEWTAHFHANDPNLQGPGMGNVNFREIANVLKEENYQGWVSVEIFDTELEPEFLAAESLKNLRSSFA